jgi:two-component system cell cycle response regulator
VRILIAEDDPVSRRVLESMLKKWGYDVETTTDGLEAWKVLQGQDPPQLAILDWMMPGMDGLQVCREVRGRANHPYCYILLLTAKGQDSDVIAGLEAGADDYLTKPLRANELRARLYTGKRILAVQRELLAAQEALRIQAVRDPLTGLFNRRYMHESLEQELHRAARAQLPLGIIMVDLDHFKVFNDTAGHLAGDILLKDLGSFLQAHTRREDVVCRYGGEEFVVILPGAPPGVTERRAELIRSAVKEAELQRHSRSGVAVTLSAGVATFPEHGSSAMELLSAADRALYRAKADGRDCVRVGPVEAAAPRTTGTQPELPSSWPLRPAR